MSPKEIPDELIDQLLAGHEGPEAITGPDGLLKHLTKRVVERAVSAELSDHLGYELGEKPPEGHSNRRNGSASKTLITDHGPVPVELPRDRDGSFEPQIVPKASPPLHMPSSSPSRRSRSAASTCFSSSNSRAAART